MTASRRSLVPLLLLPLALAAADAFAQVSVAEAWVRGMVTGQRATGAFMTLTASRDSALVGATSPVAKVVEIHEMAMDGGVAKMRAVTRIDLPAGKPVTLKPGGYHVMLMAIAEPLKEGASVPITLTFEGKDGKRTTLDVAARVRPLAEPAHKH